MINSPALVRMRFWAQSKRGTSPVIIGLMLIRASIFSLICKGPKMKKKELESFWMGWKEVF